MANFPVLKRPPATKVGMSKLGDRAVAKAPAPSASVGQGSNRSQINTYFTRPGETLELYSGDRLWARVTLTLETAGPVAVGNAQNITPVLSGKGQLLENGQPLVFDIAKGTRLYIAATAVNRVKVSIQPLPWFEQITAILTAISGGAAGVVTKVAGAATKVTSKL